jgi:predicted negative regulator of RcsB-dependent stress response
MNIDNPKHFALAYLIGIGILFGWAIFERVASNEEEIPCTIKKID